MVLNSCTFFAYRIENKVIRKKEKMGFEEKNKTLSVFDLQS